MNMHPPKPWKAAHHHHHHKNHFHRNLHTITEDDHRDTQESAIVNVRAGMKRALSTSSFSSENNLFEMAPSSEEGDHTVRMQVGNNHNTEYNIAADMDVHDEERFYQMKINLDDTAGEKSSCSPENEEENACSPSSCLTLHHHGNQRGSADSTARNRKRRKRNNALTSQDFDEFILSQIETGGEPTICC